MLDRLGFRASTVAEQEIQDGRFPTVHSPNPENAEALALHSLDHARDRLFEGYLHDF